MDINLMVLNVGNTRLAVGAFVAGELDRVARAPLTNQAEWEAAISAAWERVKGSDDPAVAAAGVNPAAAEAVEQAVLRATGQKVQWVGRDLDLPIEVATEEPAQTGTDRVLNVAAAYEQMGKACLVVDAGTALTVDACDDRGRFVGGAIAPGVEMMLGALHEKTAALPRVPFEAPAGPLGRSTTEAIRQGVYHALRGLVKEVAENYATVLGTWPEIIATGGDASRLFAGWELIHALSPDLTLYGIALAYANHHIKHGT